MGEYYTKVIAGMLIFGFLIPFLGVLAQNTVETPQTEESGNNIPSKVIKGVISTTRPFLDKLGDLGKERIITFFKGLTEKINQWWKNNAKDLAYNLWKDFLLLLEKEIIIK